MLEHQRAYGFITSITECKETKTTVLSLFSCFPKTLHFMATFWQRMGRDWRVITACRTRGYDRPSQRPGRLQSCGYTERSSTCWKPGRWRGRFAGGVPVTSSLHFPQTNHILLVHVQQNGDIPSTKEVRVMSPCTVLISGNVSLNQVSMMVQYRN